jgi:hypothetical protein
MSFADRSTPNPAPARTLALARARLAELSPWEVAERSAARFCQEALQGFYELVYLGRMLRISHPGGDVQAMDGGNPPGYAAALVCLHYLTCADGHPPADRWVSFRELPDGLIYYSAFRSRVEPALVRRFGAAPAALQRAAQTLGGDPLAFGDVAFGLRVLPRIAMAIILYAGDEEFAPAANVLFDASAGHYLPTEDLAVLGGLVVGSLIKAAAQR